MKTYFIKYTIYKKSKIYWKILNFSTFYIYIYRLLYMYIDSTSKHIGFYLKIISAIFVLEIMSKKFIIL